MAHSNTIDDDGSGAEPRRASGVRKDVLALGVAAGAIVLFVGTGGVVLSQALRSLVGIGLAPDRVLTSALLLNVALIIFVMHRYRELTREVVERRISENLAIKRADLDPLTSSINRRALQTEIDALLAQAFGESAAVAVAMIDLDNFKQVNDFNGHSIGDQLLQHAAQSIRENLPPGTRLARLGGDEFAFAMMFDPANRSIVERTAAAVLQCISEPVEIDGLRIEVSATIGIVSSDLATETGQKPRDAQALIHLADIAMYQAKKNGRKDFVWFEAQMEAEHRIRGQLEAGIRSGVKLGEFVPYFEQQIDLQTGELTGFEMLARWHSPSMGVVGPDMFIPIAEEIGVIADLSESVIAQALREAREWDPHLTLSVNISPIQLRDPWFAQKLLRMLVTENFPPQRLELEITESCLHENIGVVRTLISSLKNQGIRISLDDFGTGYSSLAQLRALPFDRIKIDRSFITNLPENADSAKIVQAITQLGEGLGMPITAEGIENAEVLAQLRGMGEYKGQGYLYGKPQSAADTRIRLASMNLLHGADKTVIQPGAAGPARRSANKG